MFLCSVKGRCVLFYFFNELIFIISCLGKVLHRVRSNTGRIETARDNREKKVIRLIEIITSILVLEHRTDKKTNNGEDEIVVFCEMSCFLSHSHSSHVSQNVEQRLICALPCALQVYEQLYETLEIVGGPEVRAQATAKVLHAN